MPPMPSALSFEVDVPVDPVLRFAIAVSTVGQPGMPVPVEFRVRVDDGSSAPGEEELVFDGVVRRREPNVWLDQEVDLTAWSSSRIRLIFETESSKAAERGAHLTLLPHWGNPVLSSRSQAVDRPNLILISLDCVRADHLGAYGYERDTSPRIDELAADAMLFETAVSVSSYTHPTHMSMLTGLLPSIHGVSRWKKPDSSVAFLPELLAQAGYRTSGIVSGPLLSQNFGFERGFDDYRVFHDSTRANVLVDTALEMLERGHGQPQFFFLHFFDAHWPYWAPEDFTHRFGPRPTDASGLLHKVRVQLPPESDQDILDLINLYDGELAYLDSEVGRFLDGLKERGLYDSSLIILTADHGEAFYEHGYWEHGQTLYEEMIHIPMIVKWPEDHPIGRVETLVSQIDVFPTLLEGAEVPFEGEARSLRLRLEESGNSESREVTVEVTWDPLADRGATMQVAWRGERLKYIASIAAPDVAQLYSSKIATEELYDLRADPKETRNLADELTEETDAYRRTVQRYLARARRLRAERGDTGQDVTLDESTLERLRALGYIGR